MFNLKMALLEVEQFVQVQVAPSASVIEDLAQKMRDFVTFFSYSLLLCLQASINSTESGAKNRYSLAIGSRRQTRRTRDTSRLINQQAETLYSFDYEVRYKTTHVSNLKSIFDY